MDRAKYRTFGGEHRALSDIGIDRRSAVFVAAAGVGGYLLLREDPGPS